MRTLTGSSPASSLQPPASRSNSTLPHQPLATSTSHSSVTVALCTWNRAGLLDRTLARMRDLVIPAGVRWEIVVVNNNCTDETSAVVARHASLLPVREIHEPQQGQSHARNAAARAARGELILWTDDDVLVDPHWLAETIAAAQAYPAHAVFGGLIEPWFEVEPPQWLTGNWPHLASAYAVRDLGAEPFEFDARRLPFGANYAIRRDVQLRFAYDGRLGRVGTGEIRGEESELLHRLLAAGHRGRWVPSAKVRHFIPSDRLTLDYVRGFYRGVGQGDAIRRGEQKPALARRISAALSQAWFATLDRLSPARGTPWAKALIRSSVQQGRLA